MTRTIIASGTTITSSTFSAANTIFIIRYNFNLNGITATVNSTSFLLFDGGTLTNGTIYGRTVDGTVRPEWFGAVGDGTTDDTSALEMTFRFTELPGGDLKSHIHNHATVVFNGTCKYKLSRSLYARLGVSIDFGGCTLLPELGTGGNFSTPGVGSSGSCPFILYVNWDKDNSCMGFIYPPRIGSISNVKVGNYDAVDPATVLGFIYLAAPMDIHDIFTSHICPVICTPDDSIPVSGQDPQVCYLDAVSISRITSVWFLHDAPQNVPQIPYIINKRSHGDSWRIEQVSNECGHVRTESKDWNLDIRCIFFDMTFGLAVTNCIHADGVIWRSSEVEYSSNHNERFPLFVNYSNATIRNCYFVSASEDSCSLILQEANSYSKACAHTIALDNVNFVIFNHFHPYDSFRPQIAIGDNGFPRIDYRDVKTNIFSPSIGDMAMRATTGFTFSYGGSIYATHFRRGSIDLTGNSVDVNKGNTLGPANGTYSVTTQILDMESSTFAQTGTYYYDIKLFNKIAQNCCVSVAVTTSSISASLSNVKKCVCMRMTPYFTDGYGVYVTRRRGSVTQYAILPVSYNGILVDWGEWINGVKWGASNPLVNCTFLTLSPNEHVDFGQGGHIKYYVNNIFKALPWTSPSLELVDVENPLQTCFAEADGDPRCYSIQPWAYVRPITTNVYHVSLGYPTSPVMYQNQIFTIRNGFDDSVVEIRISFPARTCTKTVKGRDFVTVYVDSNYGLYLQFANSSWHHCDMSIQSNQVNNLVTMVNGSNSFPDKPYSQWAGLAVVATSAPTGTTSARPANAAAGTYYFDTTINMPIWSKGNGQWTNANGVIV